MVCRLIRGICAAVALNFIDASHGATEVTEEEQKTTPSAAITVTAMRYLECADNWFFSFFGAFYAKTTLFEQKP